MRAAVCTVYATIQSQVSVGRKHNIFDTRKMYTRFTSALCKIVKSGGSRAAWTRQLSTTVSRAREMEERKIKVDDTEINYARVGTGDHPVLLLPGALGTIWTDFRPQMENLNADKLTIVAWDPPGYGKSRPPDRTFPDDFFQRDAAYARNLMRTLGYSKFSLIGWSDGGITSLLLASAYPDDVHKMVVFGANAYIHPDEAKIYESVRDINKWSEKMRTPMIQVYGEDYFRKTWSNWIDAVLRLYEKQNGDLCKQVLSKIKCPTLIIHGARDAMVLPEHPTYLKQNIADSRVHIFEKGAHNLHLRYSEEFNKLVTDFLVN
ncbi:PREDICTED: valacyclovir hydrolase isoform X1 [Wasmannia auropunctata]|uniref:valacyclovir hydrolase isoform X1 n=1 Tax=Wasmannia auropunctata TaxID=64793 RepID=UPI0005EEB06D|nr:PREDICTED: valacyclovir hydrolase isoform X1 [Wasmannia auropunctata]